MTKPLIMLAAGGTGGHLFPAQALGVELMRRGYRVRLMTDERALKYSGTFTREMIDVVPSATVRGRSPAALARTGLALGQGLLASLRIIRREKPLAMIGFGGYPTLPPLVAARLCGVPRVIHEANAVMGRANRFLAANATAIATSLPGVLARDPKLAPRTTATGMPLRPAIMDAANVPYDAPVPSGPLRLLVVGGSQGARIMSDVVPRAMELLDATLLARLELTQQVRDEDAATVRAIYQRLPLKVELAPFFSDLPARLANSHLVISRSGAGTVAELAAIGRPSVLIPLPGALDQDQFANAGILDQAGGALRYAQADLTPQVLADLLTGLAHAPERLTLMAQAARGIGVLDAAERLADLVETVKSNKF